MRVVNVNMHRHEQNLEYNIYNASATLSTKCIRTISKMDNQKTYCLVLGIRIPVGPIPTNCIVVRLVLIYTLRRIDLVFILIPILL